MRTNLPVTGKELALVPGDTIVSRTDLKGRITYVNSTFVRVSGYTAAEMIGEPHNIVRHPDMPPEAFADLWASLKSGLTWSGMVKNRCKNGDHYWVRASITPIRQRGSVIGYTSVRTPPARDEVEAAEAVYRSLREGNPGRLRIQGGEVVEPGVKALWRLVSRLTFGARMSMFLGAILAALVAMMATLIVDGSSARTVAAVIGTATIAWSIVGWIWMHYTLVLPLDAARTAINLAASGELDTSFPKSIDPGISSMMDAMRRMTLNLRAIIEEVGRSATNLRHWTHEIGSGNSELSSRTEAQAASLEQTAASVEQLTGNVTQTAQGAEQASRLAGDAAGQAKQGGEAVGRVEQTMHAISGSSDRIDTIVAVIDSLAFQTNILALNAAVEAARAGREGRGFAVVAGEVRSLANRCTAAAAEIASLIRDSKTKVSEGARSVEQAGAKMREIVASVERLSSFVGEIAHAAQEQSCGLGQINQALNSMGKGTEQNAEMVEGTARIGTRLSAEADALAATVGTI